MPCAACGYDAPADFAFCPKCGQRLAGPPAASRTTVRDDEADRRPATVLFADLTGFTALAETLDPEDIRALQTELFDAMSSAVERYDGFVEKYVGDAVMAVFGAPIAHDDDPERALHAALRMHDAVAVLAGRWRARLGGRTLALHVGIDSGGVVAGQIGAARDAAYAVTGDAVNAASRLQNAAAAGQTLVADTTFSLVRHAFEFDPPLSLTLKGKSQPVTAHGLRRALDAPQPARGLHAHGLAAPLIGREPELAAMLGDVEAMLAGQTCFVGVVADAGTGKTRLVQALLDAVGTAFQGTPLTLRRAACSSLGERAFAVPAALLRDAYGIASDDEPDTARQKLALAIGTFSAGDDEARELSVLLGVVLGLDAGAAARHYLDPEQVKRRVFAAVQAIVERRVQRGALLLVVEDLHWADSASV
ncbi:MAG TPA: adenylate/guanylate cyclase domain-containing protein, partial [Burkholderiaceae bacterium]|nr:adenylate/guanylate cyclase domain-containing protein [Burkholderiaceae bacterium]